MEEFNYFKVAFCIFMLAVGDAYGKNVCGNF